MKKSEVLKLVTVTKTLWPSWKGGDSPEELSLVVDAWQAILDDIPPDLALAAVRSLATSGREFAPPVGVIRQKALQLVSAATGGVAPDVDEAWAEVRLAASSRGYMAGQPEWSHPAVGAAVRSIGWKDLCHSTNHDALRAHFFKVYGTAQARVEAERDLPPAARAVAELHVGHRMPELDVSHDVQD